MPSTQLFSQSGGIQLVAPGALLSGLGPPFNPIGGIFLKYSTSGIAPISVGISTLSGTPPPVTFGSGGVFSSGGYNDGIELNRGETLFINKSRLGQSGILSIWLGVPAEASGGRLFWDIDVRDG